MADSLAAPGGRVEGDVARDPKRKPSVAERKPAAAKKKTAAKKKAPTATGKQSQKSSPARKVAESAGSQPATPPAQSKGLAVASLVSGIAGFSFLPVAGGVLATLLGAIALRREHDHPERYTGRGLAIAGMVMGTFNGIVPLLILTLFVSDDWTPIPFLLVSSYAVFIFFTAMRGSSGRQKLAVLGGSVLATALAIALAIGLAYLLVWAITALFTEAFSSTGDAFAEVFDGLGDAFGSCGDAFN